MLMQYQNVTHVLLRVVAGLLFAQHGAQKLFGWFGGTGADGGTVALFSLMGLAGVLEFYGGIAVMLGVFTRPAAFVLAGEMAVAYLMAHQPYGTWPIQNRGETAALFAFIFLFLAAHGAGAFALDELLHRYTGPLREPRRLRARAQRHAARPRTA